jgi:nucleotide-binding universal stress UspA family protein
MTIIVGVSSTKPVAPVVELIKALSPEAGQLCLLHVNEPIYVPALGMASGPLIGPEILMDAQKQRDASGAEALAAAKKAFDEAGLANQAISVNGLAADALMAEADSRKASVIAVSSERRSLLDSLLVGSVSRRLASAAHQSVLLVRQPVAATKPMSVVIATDHSAYADRAIAAFLALKPKGIGAVTLISAVDMQVAAAGMSFGSGVVLDAIADRAPEMEAKSQALAETLRAQLGCPVAVVVEHAPPIPAIAEACKTVKADLLVIGAKGHGLLHRVLLGSVAMHFVTASPCSLMLMRG